MLGTTDQGCQDVSGSVRRRGLSPIEVKAKGTLLPDGRPKEQQDKYLSPSASLM